MLEEVIEETSKGNISSVNSLECLTDNREEEKDSKTSKWNNQIYIEQSSIRQHILSESEDESSTHESNLNSTQQLQTILILL